MTDSKHAAIRRSKGPRAVTIKDVARLSAVSVATVTRALQGHPRVLPATRRRVEDAAATLGYRPDFIARALATGASNTIGLLIPSSGDRYWGEVATGIEERAGEAGFSVLLANSHEDPERERAMLDLFLSKRVDAIVVGAATGSPNEWLTPTEPWRPIILVGLDERLQSYDLAAARHVPVSELLASVTDDSLAHPAFAQVSFDDVGAAVTAVEHLVSLGHTRLGFLGGAPVGTAVRRVLGFRLGLEQAGLEPGPVLACEVTLEGGRLAALELFSRASHPTAIVAYDDLVAIGAMRAAHALGLRVPKDVAVIGFDDIDIAAFVEPPLTTIRQPKVEMGRLAMELLLESLGGETVTGRQTLPGTLTVRGSTGPAEAE